MKENRKGLKNTVIKIGLTIAGGLTGYAYYYYIGCNGGG